MTTPRVITFHSMKGGVGKTTLTALFASYLAYEKRARVIAFDLDGGQQSLSDIRSDELSKILDSAHKALLLPTSSTSDVGKYTPSPMDQRLGFNKQTGIAQYYPIYQVTAANLPDHLAKAAEFDYALIDMGGRFQEAEQEVMTLVDALFIPITTQTLDLKAAIKYGSVIRNLHQIGRTKPTLVSALFWTRFENWYVSILQKTEADFPGSRFGGSCKGYLRNRLKQAPSAFDKGRMLTTISSPFVLENPAKKEEMTKFFDELHSLIS